LPPGSINCRRTRNHFRREPGGSGRDGVAAQPFKIEPRWNKMQARDSSFRLLISESCFRHLEMNVAMEVCLPPLASDFSFQNFSFSAFSKSCLRPISGIYSLLLCQSGLMQLAKLILCHNSKKHCLTAWKMNKHGAEHNL
jgi:hypothetical protein